MKHVIRDKRFRLSYCVDQHKFPDRLKKDRRVVHRVTMSGTTNDNELYNEWYNEWQRMTTSGTTNGNK